jgi:hypothetical protein
VNAALRISLVLTGTIILMVSSAYAKGSYYLEIGNEVKAPQAEKNWHTLAHDYPELLKGLWYYPKAVYKAGARVGTRIQAGPIENKDEAQRICKKLFAKDTPCFVIESFQQAPPKGVQSLSEKAAEPVRTIRIVTDNSVPLPWLAGSTANTDSHEEKDDDGSMWSWLVGDDKDEDIAVSMTQPAPVAVMARDLPPAAGSSDGDVEVAEAIRVPLSAGVSEPVMAMHFPIEPEAKGIRPKEPAVTIEHKGPLPSVAMLDSSPIVTTAKIGSLRRAPVGNPSSDIVSKGAGWLNVASFRDESHASATWQRVRRAVPEKAAGLRVRIVRPFIHNKDNNTTLNVGPFASNGDAMDFCAAGIKPIDNSLNCQFSAENSNVASIERVAEFDNRLVSSAGR